jgi:hypothetical protein
MRPRECAGGGFLGATRSARPRCKAVRTPRHSISTTCVDHEPVAKRRQRWSWRCAVVTGVRSPPLRGEGHPGQDGLAGENRDNAERGFLGGMRSARPRGEAVCVPRHNMMIGAKGTPGGLEGICPGQARAFPSGVRSPPLRGGQPGSDGLAGKTRGQREGRFSRRDAVCASAWQGGAQAEACRDYGRVGDRRVAE